MSSVLVVDSGARGHVLSTAYEKSDQVDRIIVAPGCDFVAYNIEKEVVTDKGCSVEDPYSILKIAKKHTPDLVDVANDAALASGAVDLLRQNGFLTFGPTRASARIEWDKKWSREFMQRHSIPHPNFRYFDSQELANQYVRELYNKEPSKTVYIKATGPCAGKGALESKSLDDAIRNIDQMKAFGESGRVFLIEEGLNGEEFSFHAISDGECYKTFKSAQDNKKVFDFDLGDQTGGMGAHSPAMVTAPITMEIEEQFISKLIHGMRVEDNTFTGIVYFNGIATNNGTKNIEYNARWGDPEICTILSGVETDYFDIVIASLERRLKEVNIRQDNKTRICIVGTSRGYPNDYSNVRGKRIYGLERALEEDGITVYGAGVDVKDGKFYANGGRLFHLVAEGDNISQARQRGYSAMAHISVEGNNLHYRNDIAWRDIERFLK